MNEVTFTERWSAIAGDLPLPDFSPENTNQQIIGTLVDFIQAPTWDKSKRFLQSHPELLQPEVDALLQEVATHQEDDRARASIEEHRLLLARCRDMGIDAAFAELQGAQSPVETFVTELNRMCNEVIAMLRAGDAQRQQALATQLEQMLKQDLPMEGAQDFLQVLIAWLCGQDTQSIVEKLQPIFRDAYAQMVTAIEQKEPEHTDEDDALKVEDLPSIVSSVILQGTTEQRQQFAIWLIETQQHFPPVQASLGKFFECLAAVLQGETPEITSLEAPFTNLWQEFEAALATPPSEQDQQEKEKHG